MPWVLNFNLVFKALLPTCGYDFINNIMGANAIMSDFKGRGDKVEKLQVELH